MTRRIEALTGQSERGAGTPHFLPPLVESGGPASRFFRVAHTPENATYPQHSHQWGEFVYSYSGVMEISLEGRHIMAPPHFGVWLPPHVEHRGFNRHAAVHCSFYLEEALCGLMPPVPVALKVSPLIRALLDHLRVEDHPPEKSEPRERMLGVLADLLADAPRIDSYLPSSSDPVLRKVLAHLEENPGDPRALSELARLHGTTERTLIRKANRDLGMNFHAWRQRLRVMKAMSRLQGHETIEAIARDLGYRSSSSFIAMFKRLVGQTPDAWRESL